MATIYVDPQGNAGVNPELRDVMRDFGGKSKTGMPGTATLKKGYDALKRDIPWPVGGEQLKTGAKNVLQKAGPAAALALGANQLAEGARTVGNYTPEQVAQAEKEGGFVNAMVKEGMPYAHKLGTAIGKGLGYLTHGPIHTIPESPSATKDKPFVPPAQAKPKESGKLSLQDYVVAASMPQTRPPVDLPRRPQASDYVDSRSPVHFSPMVEAVQNMELPKFDPSNESYGSLFGKRLQLLNAGASLIPAVAEMKEIGEQQRRDEVDRAFKLDTLTFDRDSAVKEAELAQNAQQLGETRRRTDLDRLARLHTGGAKANAPHDYVKQLEQEEAVSSLALRYFPDAPSGFSDVVPTLMSYGASFEDIGNLYNSITAQQMQASGVSSAAELDPQKLVNAMLAAIQGGQQ